MWTSFPKSSQCPARPQEFQPSCLRFNPRKGERSKERPRMCASCLPGRLSGVFHSNLCPQFSHMVSQLSFQRDWANQTSFGTAKIMAKIREFVLPGKEKNRDGEATINHWLTHVSTLSILTSASPGLQPLFPVKSPMSYRMETSQSCVVYKELFFFFDI